MATLKKYEPKSEKELHSIIKKELDALEEGMELLKYEMGLEIGTPDLICVDSGGRLTIIEVKLRDDEGMLFQALRYYADIDRNRYAIAQMFPGQDVNPGEHPRIVLIAEEFSDDLRRLSSLVRPDVELYAYTVAEDSNGKRGMVYFPVSVPVIYEPSSEPVEIEEHRDYITEKELRPVFDEARSKIKMISSDIEEYSTQDYVGYRYKGRFLAWVSAQRKSLDVGVNAIDEKGKLVYDDSVRIGSKREDYTHILEKIRDSFQNLGGRLQREGREPSDPDRGK